MSKKRRRKIPQTLKQRILVCGSRNWTNKKVIERELEKYFEYEDAIPVVIHGCARGADTFAGKVAKKAGVQVKEFPANWEKDGLAAGYRRNQKMLDEGKPTIVLAFTGNLNQSKGTKDMVERARAARIPVKIFSK